MTTGGGTTQKTPAAIWAPALGSALFEAFCHTFFKVYSPLTVEGLHHLPNGPFLLCSNHSSHADSAALMTASGRRFRDFALLGASDYFFQSSGVRWALAPLMNVIPIERRPGPRSLDRCLAECTRFITQKGRILILYPEGTRSRNGEMGEFKAGVGWLAHELQIPLVPAYIDGTREILPTGRSMPRSHAITVRFGEAFSPTVVLSGAGSLREKRRAVAEQLACRVRRLMSEHPCLQCATERQGKSEH